MSGLACPPADGQPRRQAAWWAWFHPEIHFMTVQTERSATPRIAPAGLVFLAITSVGWGLNWPIMKQILTEWPPLSARGRADPGSPGRPGAVHPAGDTAADPDRRGRPLQRHVLGR